MDILTKLYDYNTPLSNNDRCQIADRIEGGLAYRDSRIKELEQALIDISVLAEEGKLEVYAVGSIINEALSEQD